MELRPVHLALLLGFNFVIEAADLGGLNRQKRVASGQDLKHFESPWSVSLQENGNHFCMGILVDVQWVVTTGYCVKDMAKEDIKVCYNSVAMNGFQSSLRLMGKVEEIKMHENLTELAGGLWDNDVALLKLEAPVKVSWTAKPVDLYSHPVSAGRNAVAVGWGKTKDGSMPTFNQAIDVKILDHNVCKSISESYGVTLSDNHLCIELESGANICDGDNGGALIMYQEGPRLIGIAAGGLFDCDYTNPNNMIIPAYYVPVGNFADYIKSFIN